MDKYMGETTLENMSQATGYNRWTLEKFEKYLKGEILEVGCGIGNFTQTLSKYGKVYAIDIDKSLVERVKKDNMIEAGFGDIEKGEYFFKDKKFDTVVCINVLEHIKNDLTALENIYKLLKTGGRLVLLVPVNQFLYGEIDKAIGHFKRYDSKILEKEIGRFGFNILYKRKLNLLGALGWFFAGRVLKNTQVEKSKIKIFNIISPVFLAVENIIEPIIGTSILIIGEKKL